MGRRKKLRRTEQEPDRGKANSGLGVYEGHISPLQKQKLAGMSPGLEPEVQLLRALLDDCLREMAACQDEARRGEQFEGAMKLLYRLVMAMRARDAHPGAKTTDIMEEGQRWLQSELGLEG